MDLKNEKKEKVHDRTLQSGWTACLVNFSRWREVLAEKAPEWMDVGMGHRNCIQSVGTEEKQHAVASGRWWQRATGHACAVSGQCWRTLASTPRAHTVERCEDQTLGWFKSTLTWRVQSLFFSSRTSQEMIWCWSALSPVVSNCESDCYLTVQALVFDSRAIIVESRGHVDNT
jgi:hypothetical protein